jgi:hypothetical protein
MSEASDALKSCGPVAHRWLGRAAIGESVEAVPASILLCRGCWSAGDSRRLERGLDARNHSELLLDC